MEFGVELSAKKVKARCEELHLKFCGSPSCLSGHQLWHRKPNSFMLLQNKRDDDGDDDDNNNNNNNNDDNNNNNGQTLTVKDACNFKVFKVQSCLVAG